MGMALAAITDDGDFLALDQVDVGVAIVIDAHCLRFPSFAGSVVCPVSLCGDVLLRHDGGPAQRLTHPAMLVTAKCVLASDLMTIQPCRKPYHAFFERAT